MSDDATFFEPNDPMMADASKVYAESAFYNRWPSIVHNVDKWNWEEMKRRIEAKDETERWFVTRSVDPTEDESGDMPFVPNFCIFKLKGDAPQQAPRHTLKVLTKDSTYDAEAFVADRVVDMKGVCHWRRLEKAKNVYVMCGVNEDTSPPKLYDFSTFSSMSTASGFDFGSTAASGGGFNFGRTAASGGGFNFGGTSNEKKRPREEGGGSDTPQQVVKRRKGGFTYNDEKAVYPVMWSATFVRKQKKSLKTGAKIITRYSSGSFKIKFTIENDLEYVEKDDAARRKEVTECMSKALLCETQAFISLRAHYDDLPYLGADEQEKREAGYKQECEKLMTADPFASTLQQTLGAHFEGVFAMVQRIAQEREAAFNDALRTLDTAMSDLQQKKLAGRDAHTILRMFPEKNSISDGKAIRPASYIPTVGRADECYPEPYVKVNPFTGEKKVY